MTKGNSALLATMLLAGEMMLQPRSARMGAYELPPRGKADPVKKAQRKAQRKARRRNRK